MRPKLTVRYYNNFLSSFNYMAVAFFKISLCSSRRAIFFFSSRISTCSGVIGEVFGKILLRSCFSCRTHLSRVGWIYLCPWRQQLRARNSSGQAQVGRFKFKFRTEITSSLLCHCYQLLSYEVYSNTSIKVAKLTMPLQ